MNSSGYTLLEILIVVLITGILMGTGAAGYRDFSRRQYVTASKQLIVDGLRFAQSESAAGKKGSCAGTFGGYSFAIVSEVMTIEIVCTTGNITIKEVDTDAENNVVVSMTGTNPIIFLPLNEGTNITSGSTSTISINEASVTINSLGQIQ